MKGIFKSLFSNKKIGKIQLDANDLLSRLSNDLLLEIFQYLSYSDLCTISATNKTLHKISQNDKLWKTQVNNVAVIPSSFEVCSKTDFVSFYNKNFIAQQSAKIYLNIPSDHSSQFNSIAQSRDLLYPPLQIGKTYKSKDGMHVRVKSAQDLIISNSRLLDRTKNDLIPTNSSVHIWNADTGKLERTIPTTQYCNVIDIDLSENATLAASGGKSGVASVYKLTGEKKPDKIFRKFQHNSWVYQVKFLNDQLFTLDENTVQLWDIEADKSVKAFPIKPDEFYASFNPQDKNLFTVSGSGAVSLYDLRCAEAVGTIPVTMDAPLVYHPSGVFAAANIRESIHFVDLRMRNSFSFMNFAKWIDEILFSGTGHILYASFEESIQAFDCYGKQIWKTGEEYGLGSSLRCIGGKNQDKLMIVDGQQIVTSYEQIKYIKK